MNDNGTRSIDFADTEQCLALIADLPLTRVSVVHEALASLLAGIRAAAPAPTDYLRVLEASRSALAFAQEETAERYSESALPPDSPEDACLHRVVALWRQMGHAYLHVAEIGVGDPEVQSFLALICQRSVHYVGRAISEYYRARREIEPGLWSELHGCYARAEELGIAAIEVSEPEDEERRRQSCLQAYVAVFLADLGDLYARSPREIRWLIRWSRRFAPYAVLLPPNGIKGGRTYGVDPGLDRGALPLNALGTSDRLRRLEVARLAAEIHEVRRKLKKGTPPSELGLGEDCAAPACLRMLDDLFVPWCMAARPRRFQRRKSAGSVRLCYGFEAVHFHLTGREFIQPESARYYSRGEFEAIATFRYQVDPTQALQVRMAQIGYTVETWAVADESADGFRLLRVGTGVRIEHGQLLGLRAGEEGPWLLCRVSWLMYARSGTLMAGIHVLPGTPKAVAARLAGLTISPSGSFSRAFLLPAMPALGEPACLVLPKGWFQPGRVVEVEAEGFFEAQLLELRYFGGDFDRVSFSVLS
jgi:hypothetical protein